MSAVETQNAITSLARAIDGYTASQPGRNPYATAVPGLTLLRATSTRPPMPMLYKPALCLVAQGGKTGTFGMNRLAYRAGQALIVGVEMPGIGVVTDASVDKPFLGALVEFNIAIMREVRDELDLRAETQDIRGGVFVADVDASVADCVLRLIRLLDTPRAIPAVVPAIMREISYWLLAGSDGGAIASVVFGVNRSSTVVHALHELRQRFAQTVRVDELAATARMSPSAFYRAFKAMTSMTPLQYQKQLRLLTARNLMIDDAANAETAAFRVGYESASQFSREYARAFGSPPRRDVVGVQHGRV